MIVATMGIAIALPAGVAIAVWLVEYGRPAALARVTESTIEAIAGIPSIVLALFGTVIFSSTALGFLSRSTEGVVFGRSFFAASAMLSLVALPLIVASTREGLNSIPRHVREASYAVGKTKAATTRRILLPASRPQVATGAMLGLGRIIGDTAIIVVLLGATQNFAPVEGVAFPLNYLRGAGTTLTNFVYEASPTGNLNQPQKAYAAAFVLLLMVLVLNASRRRRPPPRQKGWNVEFLTSPPPPIRRLELEDPPAAQAVAAPAEGATAAAPRRPGASPAPVARSARPQFSIRRMEIDDVSVSYADREAVKGVSLPVRQGEVLSLIGPSGCGKTTLLRSLNRLTELTSTAKLTGRILLDDVDITADRADPAAAPGDDGLPAAEPVPDERLRQHRLRPARAGLAAVAQEGAGAAGAQRPRPGRPLRGGQRQPRPPGAEALRRPAAAALHRPRPRRRTGGAAARRALLGARPAVDRR